MIQITKKLNGLFEIWDDIGTENGWIIKEQNNGSWALWDNCEFDDMEPFKIYANHELDEAIAQGKKWT